MNRLLCLQSVRHNHYYTTPEYSSNHVIHSNNKSFKCFQRRHPYTVFTCCQITNTRI